MNICKKVCIPDNLNHLIRLFHGTAKGTIPKINRNSFNRSYCGKNATVYGEGVYFAAGAAPWSICDTYSPPDEQGNKYMYLALGKPNDATPPASARREPSDRRSNPSSMDFETTSLRREGTFRT